MNTSMRTTVYYLNELNWVIGRYFAGQQSRRQIILGEGRIL